MVLVEVVDILAADDIDLGIPIAIQTVEGSELLLLLVGEVREIFLYDIHAILFLFLSIYIY